MDKHTPGPWRVDLSYDIPSVIAHCFPKGSTCVAVVYGDDDAIMARVPGERVSDAAANARLIAAAPDLLAALKALTHDSRFSLAIGGNPNAVSALIKQVDEAIANAEAK